jgi:prevent-host-death family protein
MIRKPIPVKKMSGLTTHARDSWTLQEAKARFFELVRLAQSEGPQRVTLNGCAAVLVIDAEEFRGVQSARTGQLLIDALRAMPSGVATIKQRRAAMPVRAVRL